MRKPACLNWTRAAATLAVFTAAAWLPAALAQSDETAAMPPNAKMVKPPADGDKDEGPKRFPKVEDVIKDMEEIPGLFTLYRYDPKDRDKDPERLLCKIPASLLNEDLLFATSISRGGYFTGWMWSDYLVRWEVVGDHIKMVTPDTRFVQKKDSPVTDAVKRTYNDEYLTAAKILTMTPGGDVIIDLGSLLKTDLADVSFMGGGVQPQLSKWGQIKNFPDNLLVDVDLALGGRQGGTVVGVTYAFRRLPSLGGYSPRAADDRIGYFLTARMDWSKDAAARDTFDRYVQRWGLEKRDPSLELSPPKKPIVFIIEKTVPIQWRRWVKEGILEWNKAFEKIGFVDAIVVQQQTDDNEFADYDPEDARYNFFRWIVSGDAFAMGPSRVDPRTGQILDADIIMDDSFIRAWMQDFDLFAPSTIARLKGPSFTQFTEDHPELAPNLLINRLATPDDPQEQLVEIAREKLRANGRTVCTYADGFQQQLALVHNAMIATASGKKLPERFIGEAIREVVCHEVGHTLGLRHNFKASNWLTLEEIKNRRDNTDEATVGSVMDYSPLLFFKGDEADKVRHFMTPTIGPYDYWAIEYGYGTPNKGESEDDMLTRVAKRCAEPGLAYATDEDTRGTYSPDPSVNRYDMGAKPMEWVRSRFELCDSLVANLGDWSIKDGESRYFMTRAFRTILFEKGRGFEYLGRVIGGQYFNRDHKGDPGERPAFVLVDPAEQREALKLLGETLFSDSFFAVDPALLNQLAPSRWSHWGSFTSSRMDFPIHDLISMLQWWTLTDITSPAVLQRLYDAELKSPADNKFTVAEQIRTVRDLVFNKLEPSPSGTFDDAHPYLSSIRRGLQREYLDIALMYAQSRPGALVSPDVDAMMRYSLRQLSNKIGAVLTGTTGADGSSKLDFATAAHLTECKSRIDRVLDASFIGR